MNWVKSFFYTQSDEPMMSDSPHKQIRSESYDYKTMHPQETKAKLKEQIPQIQELNEEIVKHLGLGFRAMYDLYDLEFLQFCNEHGLVKKLYGVLINPNVQADSLTDVLYMLHNLFSLSGSEASKVIDKIVYEVGFIPVLVTRLHSYNDDADLIERTCGVLSNLASNSLDTRDYILSSGILTFLNQWISRQSRRTRDNADAIDTIAWLLSSLSAGNRLYPHSGLLTMMLKLVHTMMPLVEANTISAMELLTTMQNFVSGSKNTNEYEETVYRFTHHKASFFPWVIVWLKAMPINFSEQYQFAITKTIQNFTSDSYNRFDEYLIRSDVLSLLVQRCPCQYLKVSPLLAIFQNYATEWHKYGSYLVKSGAIHQYIPALNSNDKIVVTEAVYYYQALFNEAKQQELLLRLGIVPTLVQGLMNHENDTPLDELVHHKAKFLLEIAEYNGNLISDLSNFYPSVAALLRRVKLKKELEEANKMDLTQ